jgi:2-methylcitrate dehydratase
VFYEVLIGRYSHAINYMVAYPLIFGELTSESYTDKAASDPRIDALRAKMHCVEDKRFSVNYHDPAKRSIGNALLIELNDGTKLDEVEVEYPVGHKRRRAEGTPLLINKFKRHISHHFDQAHQKKWVLYFVFAFIPDYVFVQDFEYRVGHSDTLKIAS